MRALFEYGVRLVELRSPFLLSLCGMLYYGLNTYLILDGAGLDILLMLYGLYTLLPFYICVSFSFWWRSINTFCVK
jgi:hypothetical protein